MFLMKNGNHKKFEFNFVAEMLDLDIDAYLRGYGTTVSLCESIPSNAQALNSDTCHE